MLIRSLSVASCKNLNFNELKKQKKNSLALSTSVFFLNVIVVQSLSHVRLCNWTTAHQVPLPFTISQWFFKFMSIESMMPYNLCHPLLLLPSVFPSTRVFSNELALPIWRPKYWGFSINLSNEYSGLISCRIDCFNLLAVKGALKKQRHHFSGKGLYSQSYGFSSSHAWM